MNDVQDGDAAPSPSDLRALRPMVALFGLALAGAALLPLAPGGESFLLILREAFRRHVIEGLLVMTGLGAPFLFGLALIGAVLAARRGAREVTASAQVLQSVLALMHTHLVLFAGRLAWAGVGIATWPLLGFAIVSGVYFAYGSGLSRAEGKGDVGPSAAWLARWGAVVIAPVCAWARLQMIGGLRLGIAVDVVMLACLALVFVLRTPLVDPQPAA